MALHFITILRPNPAGSIEPLVSFSSPRGFETGVWFNFLAELVAPWFVFWPRLARHIAGSVIVFLQIILILSGNLSFLNWLTILPALACLTTAFGQNFFPLLSAQIGSPLLPKPILPGPC